jgi:hypothetical protein
MKGAIADPLLKTIRRPNIRRMMIIGKSQYFFLDLKNPHRSIRKSIIAFLPLIWPFDVFSCKCVISLVHH